MRSPATTLVASCYLLLLGVGGALLAERAWDSVTSYQSEYAVEAETPAGEALTERLVFVVLDGVRVDAAAGMPHLQALAGRGASGIAMTELPSLSNPGRATLSTGAPPEVHGVTNNTRFSPPPVDSIFSKAKQQSIPVTVYGSYFWKKAFGASLDASRAYSFDKELGPSPDAERLIAWQNETCEEMVSTLRSAESGLIVAGLTATDEAGHDFGGQSAEYLSVVAAADACLGRLTDTLDSPETTFVVVADHGHIQRRGQGGHGGKELEVISTPLVLAGKAITQSSGWTARQLDVAPTISALLGLPLPANNEGTVLWEALDLTEAQRSALMKRAEEQHAMLSAKTPDRAEMKAAGRRHRALLSVAAAGWFLALIAGSLWQAGAAAPRLAGAAALHLALYFTLYWAFGLGYSLSDIVREEYLNWFFLRNAAAAGLALTVAVKLVKTDALRTALLATSLCGCRVAWVWYDSGLIMERLMWDLSQGFMAYMDLLHNLAVALTAIGLAVVMRRSEKKNLGR